MRRALEVVCVVPTAVLIGVGFALVAVAWCCFEAVCLLPGGRDGSPNPLGGWRRR